MDKKTLMPHAAQPVNRTTTGQLPPELAELSEEALQASSSTSVLPSYRHRKVEELAGACSYDGDDAE